MGNILIAYWIELSFNEVPIQGEEGPYLHLKPPRDEPCDFVFATEAQGERVPFEEVALGVAEESFLSQLMKESKSLLDQSISVNHRAKHGENVR